MSLASQNQVRLDQYVVGKLVSLSRASVGKIIDQGKVTVNGEPQTKAGYRLRENDKVIINFDPDFKPEIPLLDIEVLYEDDDCVVINKPVGLLTHSKGAFNPEATVATWLATKITDMDGDRAGIVHRLDRATSGVMIAAKNPVSLSWLQKQFAQRRTKKSYAAVAQGVFKQDEAVIDMPIERNPKKPQTFRVGSNGKPSVTVYKVVSTNNELSLVDLKPTTGRTHQLRVHLEQLGHPIVGDVIYGGRQADRLYLHAESLELTLPSKERKTFTVPVPKAFKEMVK